MRHTRCLFFALILISITSTKASAQDLNQFLDKSLADGEKLLEAYLAPAMNGISSGLNQGWYNSAGAHKVAGFDLTFTGNVMMIPSDEIWFTPNDVLGPESQIVLDENSPDFPNAPTIFGPGGDNHKPVFRDREGFGAEFTGPSGLDLKKNLGGNFVPVPMVQLGFGLPKGTDLKLRFIPQVGSDVKANLFGIGVMHDIKQWVPVMKNVPFDLSGFVGFTKMKIKAEFDDASNPDQSSEINMTAVNVQGIISKKISVLTLYGALGYNLAKSKFDMKGTYEDEYTGATVTDPFTIGFSSSGPRATAGFRLKLAVITLHADYTLQKYSCFSFGLGISVR
ncbi:MAG TPA: DUF6588 family protein [Chryseosolibacter sp.]|nr:DUF6588 family protein [Chryseosolibacter sp.]